MVLDLDATDGQLEGMARWYYGRAPKAGPRAWVTRTAEHALWSRVSVFTPWSEWAAEGLRGAGVATSRIRVSPPGVDLSLWQFVKREPATGRRLRLLFVGGDFERKGGDMLLEVMRGPLGERLELDIVTRDSVVEEAPNTRMHRAEPNSDALLWLYHQADVFVLPTRAECFGIAAVEAMASGLPVVMGNVGGAADIVEPGTTGWLVEPNLDALSRAMTQCIEAPERLIGMGGEGRRRAALRFDGDRQHDAVVSLLLEMTDRRAEV
jgi:glycosyltransferase involved in cell wall biosynthesis